MKTILRPSGEQFFLKDALRDLLVVVVGILAALYLESWWEERQDRTEEALLLEGLRAEFIINRSQLVRVMSAWSGVADGSKRALQLMGKPMSEGGPEVIVQIFQSTFGIRFFDPRTGQLNSLMNSGKLGLIENADLRARIADWPSLVDDLGVERQAAMHALLVSFGPRLGEFIPGGARGAPFDDRIEELLANRIIYNDLTTMVGNMRRSNAEGEIILRATDEIIALIDSELENQ